MNIYYNRSSIITIQADLRKESLNLPDFEKLQNRCQKMTNPNVFLHPILAIADYLYPTVRRTRMTRQSSDFFNTHCYFQRKVIFDFRHIKIKKFMEIGRGGTINN